jgi:hypothetical protein
MFSTLSFKYWNVTTRRDIIMYRLLSYSWCILSFLGLIPYASAQNLVLNPGFEDFSTCPNFIDQMNRATHWGKPTPGTPDYFNSCTSFPSISTPTNGFGDQEAFDGEAYAGLVTYVDTMVYGGFANYREYIQGKLSEPLQAGKFYAISFQVSVGDAYRYASDCLPGSGISAVQLASAGGIHGFADRQPFRMDHRLWRIRGRRWRTSVHYRKFPR